MKKVLGIGSALVDILTNIEDEETLNRLGLPKGSMQLVSADEAETINKTLSASNMAAGGSAANTISGLAKLGAEAAFLGVVGDDYLGRFFEKEMVETGVVPMLIKSSTAPSGRAQTIVTSDSERTFATYLGASQELSKEHITAEKLNGWDIFYVEGYLVSNPVMLDHALRLATDKGMNIAIDLASYNVVADNRDYLLDIVKNRANIVFANEEEAHALTGMEPEQALDFIASMCDIAVVKVGKKGALARHGDLTVRIDPMDANVVDTTGAGDMFAAGFLWGLINEKTLQQCGNIGTLLASNVIEVMGAKMGNERWRKIFREIE